MTIDINELRRLALDGDLAAMQEIILRLKAAETDAAHQKALAESALRVAEGWEEKCNSLRAAARHEADCVEAAKAEIKALRSELVDLRSSMAFRTSLIGRTEAERDALRASLDGYGDNPDARPLYALPGAQGEEK